MILAAFAAGAVLALLLVAAARSPRQMNAVCIGEAGLFLALCGYILFTVPLTRTEFLFGSRFFFLDNLGIYEALITATVFLLAAVYARGYVESLMESGELGRGSVRLFYGAWALLLPVITFAFFADNLALFWILAELTTIISAMLVAILYARENIDAALKYIFIASVSMLFAFVGLIFLFETSRSVEGAGTLNWTELMTLAPTLPAGMVLASSAFIFIGFAAKSGIFPFHTWLPEAHAKAPSAVSAVLSGVLLNVGIYGILRIAAIAHQTEAAESLSLLLAVAGILTIGIASLSMLREKNIKKLIAFSSVENMGFLLIGIAVATPAALFWMLFHVMAHAFTKAGLFFSAGILHRQYKSPLSAEADDEIVDVFSLQPLAAWGVIIGGLAITGAPLFPVFYSKLFILLELGTLSLPVVAVVLTLLITATIALGFFVIVNFSKKSDGDVALRLQQYRTPLSMHAPIVILLILILLIGIVFTAGEVSFLNTIVEDLRF